MASDNVRELLLTALRMRRAATPKKRFGAATSEDWLELVRIARDHRIGALLHWRLKEAEVAIPTDILQSLQMDHLKGAYRNTRLYHYLARVLERFHHSRIPVIPLKGAYLAQHIYDCFGIREMSDVELLVRKQDLIPMRDILSDLGCAKLETLNEAAKEFCNVARHVRSYGILAPLQR